MEAKSEKRDEIHGSTKSREWNRRYMEWETKPSLTVAEARALLDSVPPSAMAGMSRLNPEVPRDMAMGIFRRVLDGKPDTEVLKASIAKNIQREFGKRGA